MSYLLVAGASAWLCLPEKVFIELYSSITAFIDSKISVFLLLLRVSLILLRSCNFPNFILIVCVLLELDKPRVCGPNSG